MNVSRVLARGRKALRMTPRQLSARIVEAARHRARRPWAAVYPRLLRERAILGHSGANSLTRLWQVKMASPFFVVPADKDTAAAEFRRRYPGEAARIVEDADAVMRHEFDLLGSGVTSLGPSLPWLDDFKTGRHYPLQYCRDIQYMELDKPTDVKVPWELSRCQHFTTLGQAYWISGDERYAREYRAEIEDWVDANPFAYSVNWACAMDVALRAIGWIWGFYFMAGSEACADDAFRGAMLRSLFLHGEFVFRHLEKSDVNGNHYLSDGAGLVFLGLFFRHTVNGRRWLDQGKAIVFGQMMEQVSADGVDFEQSTAYHRLVLELFLTSYLLLDRCGEAVPAPQLERLEKMLEFVAAYTKPNGLAPLIGDADDGRVQKLGPQAINDHRYLLSTGAVRFARGDFKRAAGRFWEESFWLLGPLGAAAFDALPAATTRSGSHAFSAGGFYILRGLSSHVVVDCGEVGMRGRGGHGHNDITSFELFLNGMNVITDCGAYLYTASREWRNKYRSTAFHNVAQVDDEELNRFVGEDALWQLHDDAHPIDVAWEVDGAGTYFRGGHDGYARLFPPVRSTRELFVDAERPCVTLRDRLEGASDYRVTWRFHLDPLVSADVIEDDVRIRQGDREVWLLAAGRPHHPRIVSGWVSPSYGVRLETSVVEMTGHVPAMFSCVFADTRLSADQRRLSLDQLDARTSRAH